MLTLLHHLMSNSIEQQNDFFDVIRELSEMSGSIDTGDVRVPFNQEQARRILLEGRNGVLNNLPYIKVEDVGGHAVISIIELFKQLCAMGVPMKWTETDERVRDRSGINGTRAMDEMIEDLKKLRESDLKTFIAWFETWTDGFITSYVCQHRNNAWIMTITFPDPTGSQTLQFHTHCVAVGHGCLDHTPVIDWLLQEMEVLACGVKV